MLAVVESSAVAGVDAYAVRVEVNVATAQVPQFTVVGLPDAAVQESRERVRAAVKNSGLMFPADRRITVNLAPADTKKAGPSFDLPIAVGILAATGQLSEENTGSTILIGELGLDGSVRPVSGVLPIAIQARKAGVQRLIVPAANTREAAIVGDVDVYPVHTLADVLLLLNDLESVAPVREDPHAVLTQEATYDVDFSDVKGQAHIKRALEVAAAGGHNVLLVGSPGSGKTMLARRMPTILPPLSVDESLEVTKLYSVSGLLPSGAALVTQRPFRSPHHTISNAGLTGGGSNPRPGEVSLAHHGVLFLDELPEFNRDVLEVMRQPLEDGHVTIARAAATLTYPARFTLVAAMNPCPCGYFGDALRACTCTPGAVQKYQNRISGPLLDRIDIQVEVPRLKQDELTAPPRGETSAAIRERVLCARAVQAERFAKAKGLYCNAHMGARQIQKFCDVQGDARALLSAAIDQMSIFSYQVPMRCHCSRSHNFHEDGVSDLYGGVFIMKPRIREKLDEAITTTGKAAIGAAGALIAGLATGNPDLAMGAGIATPIITEFFGIARPSRGMKRVEEMVNFAMAMEMRITPDTLRKKLENDEEFAAVFERGCIQAFEALSKVRLQAIAGVVASQFSMGDQPLVAHKFLSILNDLDDLDIYLLRRMPEPFGFTNNHDNDTDEFSPLDLRKSTDNWFKGRERTQSELLDALNDDGLSSEIQVHRAMGEHSMKRMESFGLVKPAQHPKLTYSGEPVADPSVGWKITKFGSMLVDYMNALQSPNSDG